MQLLALPTDVQADEMTQMLQREVTLHLKFEGKRACSIRTGLLTHLHHQIPRFGFGEDQLTSDRKIVIPLRQRVIEFAWSGSRVLGSQIPAICRCS